MITASIVVYHTAARELLRVINCAVRSAIEILYIIDNSSNDSLRELKDVSEKIVYIHSDNLGYGSGHNIGIKKAVEKGATYHVVLNPDIYWNDFVIEALSRLWFGNASDSLSQWKYSVFMQITAYSNGFVWKTFYSNKEISGKKCG